MRSAEQWVDIYVYNALDYVTNQELAVLGPNIAGLLVDFRGEIPSSNNFKKDTLGWRVDKMRHVSSDFLASKELMSLLTPKQRRACIEWSFYRETYPDGAPHRLRTKEHVAGFLHVHYQSWIDLIRRGHDRITAELGYLDA